MSERRYRENQEKRLARRLMFMFFGSIFGMWALLYVFTLLNPAPDADRKLIDIIAAQHGMLK